MSEVMNIIIFGAHLVTQSVNLIFSLSTASLARIVFQVNPVSTRNMEFTSSLLFGLCYILTESQRSNLQLLSRPHAYENTS
jgi:hypothetical protein